MIVPVEIKNKLILVVKLFGHSFKMLGSGGGGGGGGGDLRWDGIPSRKSLRKVAILNVVLNDENGTEDRLDHQK